MSGKGSEKGDKEEAGGQGPQGFAEMCQRMMTAEARECCGSQMQEMMSRCMARFQGEQKEPR